MSFESDLQAFVRKLDRRTHAVFVDSTGEVQKSVQDGSSLTGAPGQPVDTGYLKGSWIGEFTGQAEWQLTTGVSYAPVIEENTRDAYDPTGTKRPPRDTSEFGGGTNRKGPSTVGGHHSVKLTRGGWKSIVEHVRRQVVPDG